MDTLRELPIHRRVHKTSVREIAVGEFNVYAPERPAGFCTELHWFERRDGAVIGIVRRDHSRQEFEFVVFAIVGDTAHGVAQQGGISERSAACAQVVAAMECDPSWPALARASVVAV